MKYTSALLLGGAAFAAADLLCKTPVQDALGNYYCGPGVKQIKYNNLDIPGKYRKVAKMDNTGVCTYEDHAYSGPIAPYNEGLSMHFRGPLKLLQVAVYTPGNNTKPAAKPRARRHGHQHLHKKRHQHHQERAVGDMVVATIDGQVVSWKNTYAGPTADAPAPAGPAPTAAAGTTTTAAPAADDKPAPPKPVSSTKKPSGHDDEPVTGDFVRSAYYDSSSSTADGLVFLANVGDGKNSGVFDTVWGSSLAYVDENGSKAASSPCVLKENFLSDNQEIAIFSDVPCDDSCGAYRPGSVAYKGFEGASKVFVVQFTMPKSGKTGFNMDMPAYWLLNAAIPRTGQYTHCSCWMGDNASPLQGGCGELDVVEVLSSGDLRGKSTFHFANGLGDSHYFDRPVDAPLTVALVIDEASASVTIKALDSFDFSSSLTTEQVQQMTDDEPSGLLSLMAFA
ncbi:TOS1 protein [Xylariaceae sp. FL0594]|nr:TOS1 protein [Xylariaceae sp. FL0594]